MKHFRILTLALGAFAATAAHATWYTTEASFAAALATPSYTEDFNGATFGSISGTSYVAPGANGYGWTATTLDSTGSGSGGLYSNVGSLSTNISNTNLVLTFSGSPVKAFGGRIANTDITGAFIAGTETITLSTGQTSSITTGAGESFLGWVGSSTFASVSLIATNAAVTNNWIQLDHAITGTQAVPEPTTVAALGLGALALLKRRKKA